jgi:hypothetical protein
MVHPIGPADFFSPAWETRPKIAKKFEGVDWEKFEFQKMTKSRIERTAVRLWSIKLMPSQKSQKSTLVKKFVNVFS